MLHVFTEIWGCWKPRSTYCSDIFSECWAERTNLVGLAGYSHMYLLSKKADYLSHEGSIRKSAINLGGTVKRLFFSPEILILCRFMEKSLFFICKIDKLFTLEKR
ncbi:hypothetical protein J2Z83_002852 [Virgibacillus natechei]|uniref:Uncharacterized protein n=1 Tax=Virgibacillus natechei TaxID=1216297 RepID=A0ABS4IK50_9BACI|nr:hypothetical protein [Virgibacillus natechei]